MSSELLVIGFPNILIAIYMEKNIVYTYKSQITCFTDPFRKLNSDVLHLMIVCYWLKSR